MFKFGTKTSGCGMGWTDLSVYKQRQDSELANPHLIF